MSILRANTWSEENIRRGREYLSSFSRQSFAQRISLSSISLSVCVYI